MSSKVSTLGDLRSFEGDLDRQQGSSDVVLAHFKGITFMGQERKPPK
jgi:hypothetical protein